MEESEQLIHYAFLIIESTETQPKKAVCQRHTVN